MAFGKLIGERGRPGESHGILYDPAQFRRILERERALSDRIGKGFSLLTFEVNGLRAHPRRMRKLVTSLNRQIRISDEIGWFEEDRIGVLLSHTMPRGAAVLAERVRTEAAFPDWPAEYAIYCYPSPPQSSGPSGPSGPKKRPVEAASPQGPDSASSDQESSRERPTALEPYLTPPIPMWKRCLDVAGALAGLLVSAPLFGAIALMIKLTSPGPVLFRQQRLGFMRRPFTIWKFRTMHIGSGEDLHRRHLQELIGQGKALTKLDAGRDPRIIAGGRLLRLSGLDELPQLINVLRGEMSLVGPRPCLPYEAEQYELWQRRRFDTLPGLTGLWQVNGKNETTLRQMTRLDIGYLKKRNIGTDLQIALKTVPAIVAQRSAKKTGRKT